MQMIKYFKNDKWGFRDEKLNLICEPKYDWVEEFHKGFTKVKTNVNWLNNSVSNKEIAVAKFNKDDNVYGGLVLIKDFDGNFFMYSFENEISDLIIEESKNIKIFFKDEDHFILNYTSETYYDGINHLINGFAKVYLEDKVFFIDSKGMEIFPVKL